MMRAFDAHQIPTIRFQLFDNLSAVHANMIPTACILSTPRPLTKTMKMTEDLRWNDTNVTKSSGNVFIDLGFDPAEAEVMRLRAEIMIRTAQQLKAQDWTQAETPNAETRAAIDELETGQGRRSSNIKALMDDLHADD